jgi:hypothetical protein
MQTGFAPLNEARDFSQKNNRVRLKAHTPAFEKGSPPPQETTYPGIGKKWQRYYGKAEPSDAA